MRKLYAGIWIGVMVVGGVLLGAPTVRAADNDYPYAQMACIHVPYAVHGTRAGWCADYDWGLRPNDESRASVISPYGYYYRNCTDYAAWWLAAHGVAADHYKGLGDAKHWPVAAQQRGLAVTTMPAYGAIGVRTTGTYGHIAVVEAVDVPGRAPGTIRVTEYNRQATGVYGERIGTPAELGLTQFVHFGVAPPVPAVETPVVAPVPPPLPVEAAPAVVMPESPVPSEPAPAKEAAPEADEKIAPQDREVQAGQASPIKQSPSAETIPDGVASTTPAMASGSLSLVSPRAVVATDASERHVASAPALPAPVANAQPLPVLSKLETRNEHLDSEASKALPVLRMPTTPIPTASTYIPWSAVASGSPPQYDATSLPINRTGVQLVHITYGWIAGVLLGGVAVWHRMAWRDARERWRGRWGAPHTYRHL